MRLARSPLVCLLCGLASCARDDPPANATREAAYRENNLGVARLEQYAYDAAVESFRRAIAVDSRVDLPHVNLAIALYYAADLDAAAIAAADAAQRLPESRQALFVQGLVARARQRVPDAVEAFERVLTLDADDVGSLVNLGQLRLEERRVSDAVPLFRAAVAREPFNATAVYGLGQALIRSGAADEGARLMTRFEQLRESGAAITYSQTYLEQGRYAEALVSTGLERDLIDPGMPDVRLSDVTAQWAPPAPPAPSSADPDSPASNAGGGIVLSDLDGDDDLDLIAGERDGVRVWRWTGARFEAAGSRLPDARQGRRVGLVAGDLDNDDRPDLLVLSEQGFRLHRQDSSGAFVPLALPIAVRGVLFTAALLDADHDGDLDVLTGGAPAPDGASPVRLFRNLGAGTLADVTAAAGLRATGPVRALSPTDFDNGRDIDVLMLVEGRSPHLFANQRNGAFRDVGAEVGLQALSGGGALASGDFNKDGRTDFFVASSTGPAQMVSSEGRTRFTVTAGPATSHGLTAVQAADYDNDGLLDLVGIGKSGLRIFRNVGTAWSDVTGDAMGAALTGGAPLDALALGDIDRDGDLDIAIASDGGVRLLRNDSASTNRSLSVRLAGRVSNRSGVGAKVDVRAGSLWQRRELSAVTPAVAAWDPLIGLGARARADVVRVLWPAGIVQADTLQTTPGARQRVVVTELDRKPSSCPYLFTWSGRAFEFVTDFLGGGEVGYWTGPHGWNVPDADETVRITDQQLIPRDGRLELRVTNELEEVLYLDTVQLSSVDHAADVEIYPREGMRAVAPAGVSLVAVRRVRPMARVTTDRGEDLTREVSRRDGLAARGGPERAVRGYAEPHALILETHAAPTNGRHVLLLTGWTDYAFSSDNVAAAERGWVLHPPALETRVPGGPWRTLVADVGIPVGRPQTVVVDIGHAAEAGGVLFRLRTSMRIHWDAIALADVVPDTLMDRSIHGLERATLTWRGYSRAGLRGGVEWPDYAAVSSTSPWKVLRGRYTREGDVRALLVASDDRQVVARTGDEIALVFADTPRAAAHGRRRTYLLHAAGFSKEMDLNSASPDHVMPLPYRGMPTYPPPPAPIEVAARQRETFEQYHHRVVARTVPTLVSGARP